MKRLFVTLMSSNTANSWVKLTPKIGAPYPQRYE